MPNAAVTTTPPAAPSDAPPAAAAETWQPRIVAFFCNWCTYTAADLAGVGRMRYAPNARIIRVMCSGRIDPQFVFDAFAKGADGVLVGGCHPGDCHYVHGNFKTLRRFRLIRRVMADLGIAPERFRLEWISAAEGEKVRRVMDEMAAQMRALGPLALPEQFARWDQELAPMLEAAEAEIAAEAGVAQGADQPPGTDHQPLPKEVPVHA